MLENEDIETANAKVENDPDQDGDKVKKPRRRRRQAPVKKPVLAGPWPKIAIAAIVLCIALAGFLISTSSSGSPTTPVIQNVSISDIVESSAVVTWKTSEPATGQVTICSTENCTSTKIDEGLFLNHTFALTDIEPNTRYQLTIISKSQEGIEARLILDLTLNTKTTIVVGPEIGNIAPDFTLTAVDGKQVTLSEFHGKAVMVNFFDIACPSCEEEMPYIQGIFDTWPRDKLEIIAIAGERAQLVQSFLDTRGLTFTALIDTNLVVKNNYLVPSYPTTFFINSDGVIKLIKTGKFSSQAEIEAMLNAL
ncbi:MAG TPA: redoxin domain-containing protein [Dehalococcoidia bacterium]